jgi:polar amino acid transport system permease protein
MDYYISMLKFILEGASVTLKIYFVTLVISIPIGMTLAVLRANGNKMTCSIIDSFTWIIRGTPLLLQLYFINFGLPIYGIAFERMTVAYIGFSINYSAYFTEIFRGGIESIDKGQYEAAETLGMSKTKTFMHIILPQGVKRVLPSVTNETITLVKDTALVAAIALGDILRQTKLIASREFVTDPYLVAAVLYLLMTLVVVRIFRRIEKRFSYFN